MNLKNHSSDKHLDIDASLAQAPRSDRQARLGLIKDLKLLFASLGAGSAVIPLGDNSRTAHLLAEYARSLRTSN